MSTRLVRFIGYCLVIGCWFAYPVLGQEPSQDAYAGLSAEAAQAKFERAIVDARRQQREALQDTRQDLEQLLATKQLDQSSRDLLEQVIKRLTSSRDYLMTLEFVLQVRGQLKNSLRPAYEVATTRLTEKWGVYQHCKLDYQLVVGKRLAERWPNLSLESKRCELADYLALSEQRPVWLMRGTPINTAQMIPKSAKQSIDQYEAEKRDLVRSAQDQLQPMLNQTVQTAREAANDPLSTEGQRKAASAIAQILEAPYARGLRGVLLCQPTDELPAKLRLEVQALLDEYLQELKSIAPAHNRLLRDLNTRLESGQRDRLANMKFEEQMAIDISLVEATHLIRPIRVLASRSTRSNYHESAWLLELSKSNERMRYRVEFVIDGVTQWIKPSQIKVFEPRKRADANPSPFADQPNQDAPGVVVTELTDFDSGQVFAHSPAGWKPVNVVDESALGVVIRWHGAIDPVEFTYPREQLRIVPTQSWPASK